MSTGHDIVIVGAGAGGIGLAASLRKRDKSLKITIVDGSAEHYYQAAWTLVGGGQFDINRTVRQTGGLIPRGVTWIKANVLALDPDNNQVSLDNGTVIDYKQLVVAPGLKVRWDAIEGLEQTLGQNGVTSNYRFDLAPYTWSLVKQLTSGTAIFTQPPMPIKCAGAPQKALYLSAFEWERKGILKNIKIDFHNAGGALFSVAAFVPPLMRYIERYHANLHFGSNLVAVDGPAHKAWFAEKDANGETVRVEKHFDFLHVVPPQGPHDFVKASKLGNADGWVDVNRETLQHVRYANVFSLGDASSAPNAKTAAAVRKQTGVVARNLLAARAGQKVDTLYDGYGGCPLTVEVGKVLLAEFGYEGKLLPTFPLDPQVPSRFNWILKKTVFPLVYWNALLKGREWLAGPRP